MQVLLCLVMIKSPKLWSSKWFKFYCNFYSRFM